MEMKGSRPKIFVLYPKHATAREPCIQRKGILLTFAFAFPFQQRSSFIGNTTKAKLPLGTRDSPTRKFPSSSASSGENSLKKLRIIGKGLLKRRRFAINASTLTTGTNPDEGVRLLVVGPCPRPVRIPAIVLSVVAATSRLREHPLHLLVQQHLILRDQHRICLLM